MEKYLELQAGNSGLKEEELFPATVDILELDGIHLRNLVAEKSPSRSEENEKNPVKLNLADLFKEAKDKMDQDDQKKDK